MSDLIIFSATFRFTISLYQNLNDYFIEKTRRKKHGIFFIKGENDVNNSVKLLLHQNQERKKGAKMRNIFVNT